jgi:hypothetical protein
MKRISRQNVKIKSAARTITSNGKFYLPLGGRKRIIIIESMLSAREVANLPCTYFG